MASPAPRRWRRFAQRLCRAVPCASRGRSRHLCRHHLGLAATDSIAASISQPLPEPAVVAAAPGQVVWAAPMAGGWGNLVIVRHTRGVQSMYAHLAHISVSVGQQVQVGEQVGLVGATGDATGPHLHFEVHVRGASVNPLPALP